MTETATAALDAAAGVATVLCLDHPVRVVLGPMVAGLVFMLLSHRAARSAVAEG